MTAQRGDDAHFVTVRLEYVDNQRGGRTPWKRRGRCTCGWQCLSWDGLRPILMAADHVAIARRFDVSREHRSRFGVVWPIGGTRPNVRLVDR